MIVLIAGGGRTGTQLAMMLLGQNHVVRVVENRKFVLARIHRELPTEVIYEGNPADPDVLEAAGIRDANVLAACTTSDEDNLIICFLSRSKFHIPRTIARINNPRNAWLFDQKFHVDVPLNQSEVMARLIEEEMSLGDMMTLLKLRRGQYSVIEEKIPAGAKAVGVAIKDLTLPEQCVIAAIIRDGKVIVPRGITTLEVGDEILAVTDRLGAKQLVNLFAPPQSAENGV
jgi:trk system potassium uptake protein TrkA